MRQPIIALVTLSSLLLLSGCGQKGPLFIPDDSPVVSEVKTENSNTSQDDKKSTNENTSSDVETSSSSNTDLLNSTTEEVPSQETSTLDNNSATSDTGTSNP